jgi:hypothetical protein
VYLPSFTSAFVPIAPVKPRRSAIKFAKSSGEAVGVYKCQSQLFEQSQVIRIRLHPSKDLANLYLKG